MAWRTPQRGTAATTEGTGRASSERASVQAPQPSHSLPTRRYGEERPVRRYQLRSQFGRMLFESHGYMKNLYLLRGVPSRSSVRILATCLEKAIVIGSPLPKAQVFQF